MYAPPGLPEGECYCGTHEFHIYDSAIAANICTQCGVVVDHVLDDTPEYQYGDDGRDNGFHGIEKYSTYIDDGRALTKRLQASMMTCEERRSRDRREILLIICGAFKIDKDSLIMKTSLSIAELHQEKVQLSGKKRVASLAAAFYFACKIHNAAREIRSISTTCGIDIGVLNFGLKSIREHLADTAYMSNAEDRTLSSNHTLAERFVNMLDIDAEQRKVLRRDVLNKIDAMTDAFSSGKKPRTIVSAVIFITMFSLGIRFDKKKVASQFGVCTQSIDGCMRSLKKQYNLDF
jgi:transcription initiation factor TFIIIB Brf1 subunit/transcription initiation factor TFIIB